MIPNYKLLHELELTVSVFTDTIVYLIWTVQTVDIWYYTTHDQIQRMKYLWTELFMKKEWDILK